MTSNGSFFYEEAEGNRKRPTVEPSSHPQCEHIQRQNMSIKEIGQNSQSTGSTLQLNNQGSLGNRKNSHHHISKLSALSIRIGLPDQSTANENSTVNQICPARRVFLNSVHSSVGFLLKTRKKAYSIVLKTNGLDVWSDFC